MNKKKQNKNYCRNCKQKKEPNQYSFCKTCKNLYDTINDFHRKLKMRRHKGAFRMSSEVENKLLSIRSSNNQENG